MNPEKIKEIRMRDYERAVEVAEVLSEVLRRPIGIDEGEKASEIIDGVIAGAEAEGYDEGFSEEHVYRERGSFFNEGLKIVRQGKVHLPSKIPGEGYCEMVTEKVCKAISINPSQEEKHKLMKWIKETYREHYKESHSHGEQSRLAMQEDDFLG